MNIESLKQRVLKSSALLVALGFYVVSYYCHSASSNEGQIYQIEVIIFERLNQADPIDPEQWHSNVVLDYPFNWHYLIDPNAPVDSGGELVEPPTSEQVDDQTPENGAISVEPLPPEPFTLLPDEAKMLIKEKRAINRQRHLRVLFHETWEQPLYAEQDAPALVVLGGKTYADHYELEGTITLHVSRYLHINTNLWLTEFIPNFGQEMPFWPTLPAIPSQTPLDPLDTGFDNLDATQEKTTLNLNPNEAAFGDSSFRLRTHNSDYSINANQLNKNAKQLKSYANTNTNTNTPNKYESGKTSNPDQRSRNQFSGSSWNDNNLFSNSSLGAELLIAEEEKEYLTQRIVTLKQTRKMRRDEMHYIDHPRIGLLVKIIRAQHDIDARKNLIE